MSWHARVASGLSDSARELVEMLDSVAAQEADGTDARDGSPSARNRLPASKGRASQARLFRPAFTSRFGPGSEARVLPGQETDLLVSSAYGALGAFIGAGLWCAVATVIHGLVGRMAVAVGFVAGMGTAMGQRHRSVPLVIVAMLLTAVTWGGLRGAHHVAGNTARPARRRILRDQRRRVRGADRLAPAAFVGCSHLDTPPRPPYTL